MPVGQVLEGLSTLDFANKGPAHDVSSAPYRGNGSSFAKVSRFSLYCLRLSQAPDDAAREGVDADDEQDAEPEQPAVRVDEVRQQRNARQRRAAGAHEDLQIALREHEQRRRR